MTDDPQRPLEPWAVALGLVVYGLCLLVALFLPDPAGALAAALGWGVLAGVSGALYAWRRESFWEGFATGVVGWPLSIPFAIWGLRPDNDNSPPPLARGQ